MRKPAPTSADREAAAEAVRRVVREHVPAGYEEVTSGGMTVWQVPLDVYPDTYNGKPLMYAAVAAQKSHAALYLCNVYGMPVLRERFEAAWAATGRKLDMGKSCVRFQRVDDVAMDAVADAIAATPVDEYVAHAREVASRAKRR